MGGICGFVGKSDKSLLKSMCDAFSHRGSRRDYYIDEDISFAAIAHEDEAAIVKSDDLIMAFEGEIYNSNIIKCQPAQSQVISNSLCDAELVLQLFKENGARAFSKLRGSFACTVWNASRQELTLVRDHFGQSTLYHCLVNDKIFFASEIKPLLRIEEVPRLVNLEALAKYFLYGYVPPPNTLFYSISKLPASSSISYRQRSWAGPDRYWNPPKFQPEIFNEREAVNRVYRTLLEKVRSGVEKHKKFAILLSGGLDSSLLAGFARKFTSGRIDSYTFVPSGQKSSSAELIADQLDLTYHEVNLAAKDAIKIFGTLPKIYDDLIADPFMSIPTYALVEAAQHEHCIFAADCADVIFWGLPMLYDSSRYLNMLKGTFGTLRRVLLEFMRKFEIRYALQRSLENILEATFSASPFDVTQRIFTNREVKKLLPMNYIKLIRSDQDNLNVHEAYTLESFYMKKLDMIPDTTANISRIRPICATFSVKLFEPFLDVRLIEIASKLPSSLKQPSRNKNKQILRKMAHEYELLPKGFQPRKIGLSCPLDDWYREELKEWVSQTLLDELPNFINRKFVTSLLRRGSHLDKMYVSLSDYRTATRDVFALLMFILWFKEYALGIKP